MNPKDILEKMTVSALKLLSIRPQSEWEMRQKLGKTARYLNLSRADESLYIGKVLETLKQDGHLDDLAFAFWYADQRLTFRPRSTRRLKVELMRRGLSSSTITRALVSYDERLACAKVVQKKQSLPREKLIAFLKREGFSWDTIQQCIDPTNF